MCIGYTSTFATLEAVFAKRFNWQANIINSLVLSLTYLVLQKRICTSNEKIDTREDVCALLSHSVLSHNGRWTLRCMCDNSKIIIWKREGCEMSFASSSCLYEVRVRCYVLTGQR